MTDNSMEIQGMDFEACTGRGSHEHAQCAYILYSAESKGGLEAVKAAGLSSFFGSTEAVYYFPL